MNTIRSQLRIAF